MKRLLLVLAMLAAACEAGPDGRFGHQDGVGIAYGRSQVPCDMLERCVGLLSEIEGWIGQYGGGRTADAVTFHWASVVRSGGSTYVAIVRFGDGSQTELLVGCGVGLDQEKCFSEDTAGRHHDSHQPVH